MNSGRKQTSNGVKNICIIPARGRSKRIPNKNIVDFHGKPLIAYTIEAARKSNLFGKNIYISSDSSEILKVARRYHAQTILRPQKISGDKASLEEATVHLLEQVGKNFDNLCMLMPTSPLRNSGDIKESFQIFQKTRAGCLMSVASYHWLYPLWALEEKTGTLHFFFGRKYLVDSKALPKELYCPAGGIRWVKIAYFLQERKFYGKHIAKYVIPFERAADIDTYEDLQLAKKFYLLK